MRRWWALCGLLALLLTACAGEVPPLVVTVEAGKPSFLFFYTDN
jgi:hypothetical protein